MRRLGGLAVLGALLVGVTPVHGQAPLAHFHQALRQGRARVFVYGASHTAAGRYLEALRAGLEARHGRGGPGWVVPSPPFPYYEPQRVMIDGHGWTGLAQRFGRRVPRRLGLAGIALDAEGPAEATAVAERAFDQVELHFLRRRGGGTLTLHVNGRETVVDTALTRGAPRADHVRLVLPEPAHRVRLSSQGRVRVFGLALDRADGGVTVDNFGVPGARFSDQSRWDEAALLAGLSARSPDLVVFAYGTNESANHRVPLETYRARLRRGLRAWRQRVPRASCVLLGPGDWPREDARGRLRGRPRLASIVAIQRAEARLAGCVFVDTFSRMGGEGSMERWVERGWGSPDYVHFTDAGYREVGRWLLEALDLPGQTARTGSAE